MYFKTPLPFSKIWSWNFTQHLLTNFFLIYCFRVGVIRYLVLNLLSYFNFIFFNDWYFSISKIWEGVNVKHSNFLRTGIRTKKAYLYLSINEIFFFVFSPKEFYIIINCCLFWIRSKTGVEINKFRALFPACERA